MIKEIYCFQEDKYQVLESNNFKVKIKSEIEEILKQDPFYIANVNNYEIMEFISVITANGFDNLKDD